MSKACIYLDYAAASPLDKRVLAAMQPFFAESFYNPSATYAAARQTKKFIEAARAQSAHWLGARLSEIIFTAGGTEANNLAIHGVVRKFPKGNLVVSSIEHESVLSPAAKYDVREVKVAKDGRIDLADLDKKIDENTVLVSIGYANNEIGTIQPIREIAKLIQTKRVSRPPSAIRQPLLFHTDACQAANYLDLHVSRLGVDMLTLNGGKIYGPKQTGLLYAKAGVALEPLVDGGGQERGERSGTENVPGIIGFAKALDLAQADRASEGERLKQLQQRLISEIQTRLPQVVVNGSLKHRLPNNVHLTFPGQDNERLLIQLDEAGIQAAAGSACSASKAEPSHVLKAIGLSNEEARASLRFTMGRQTDERSIDEAVKVLSRALA